MTAPRSSPWRRFGIAACLALPMVLLAACGNEEARLPNRDNFTAAAADYLAQRGHVCLAKYDWPIKVATGSNAPDAQQMPLLEKLGFVTGKDVAAAREYALTDTGRQHYLQVPVVVGPPTPNGVPPGAHCAAPVSRDPRVGWDPPQTRDERTTTSLLFTYRIALDPWAAAPEVQQAFPLLARAIQREGTMQMRLGVHLTRRGWVADELDLH